MSFSGVNIIAISVGNTRTAIGHFIDGELQPAARFLNTDQAGINSAVKSAWNDLRDTDSPTILIASVNDPIADALQRDFEDLAPEQVYRAEVDFPIPIGRQLDAQAKPGVDRLLNAAAAFSRLKQACIIVDAGTAITVDFVDGEGTFQGGAIAPGAAMQLASLHQHTASLPDVKFDKPDSESFGRNTKQAMLQGVYFGIQGMVRRLVENYAEAYGAFPMVIATGGDAQTIFEDEELVERIVPDLTLIGLALTAQTHLYGLASDATESTSD
ncbi:MAG TPA: type III pantothenate kinase [Phycisphaerales bacterium]|nr:type III pantothenate kinase [Phycisphaerales bacterium]